MDKAGGPAGAIAYHSGQRFVDLPSDRAFYYLLAGPGLAAAGITRGLGEPAQHVAVGILDPLDEDWVQPFTFPVECAVHVGHLHRRNGVGAEH